jgi:hypothetical protein
MDRLAEDLATGSAQLANLLTAHARLIALLATLPPGGSLALGQSVTLSRLDYTGHVQGALQLVRRAEAWLETIDHETGAHASLPGLGENKHALDGRTGCLCY